MILFPLLLLALFVLVTWQLVTYMNVPQGNPFRKTILIRLILLLCVVAISSYAWRSAIQKETAFLDLLLPYPGATIDVFKTPMFSDSPYWTYQVKATPDEIFNWYRSRSKHAGWSIGDEGMEGARVFVVVVPIRISIFVILEQVGDKTFVTYTTEGQMMRETIKK